MGDHFDISGVFETTEFEIAKSACNNIVKISKNRWIGYMLKVAFLLASSIHLVYYKFNST